MLGKRGLSPLMTLFDFLLDGVSAGEDGGLGRHIWHRSWVQPPEAPITLLVVSDKDSEVDGRKLDASVIFVLGLPLSRDPFISLEFVESREAVDDVV